MEGCAEMSSATRPATCGPAMLVPLQPALITIPRNGRADAHTRGRDIGLGAITAIHRDRATAAEAGNVIANVRRPDGE